MGRDDFGTRTRGRAAALIAVLGLARAAAAQQEAAPPAAEPSPQQELPPPPPPPPGYAPAPYPYPYPAGPAYPGYPAAPRPEPPEPQTSQPDTPGYHLHDGFFLRLAGGVGYVHASGEAAGGAKLTGSGGGLSWTFEFGATPIDGFVIGAGYSGIVGPLRGDSANMLMFGPFVNVFPDPGSGLELGAAIAFAPLQLNALEDRKAVPGFSPALSAGYTRWISANWSMGGLLRASLGWHEDERVSARSRSIALVFNSVYH